MVSHMAWDGVAAKREQEPGGVERTQGDLLTGREPKAAARACMQLVVGATAGRNAREMCPLWEREQGVKARKVECEAQQQECEERG